MSFVTLCHLCTAHSLPQAVAVRIIIIPIDKLYTTLLYLNSQLIRLIQPREHNMRRNHLYLILYFILRACHVKASDAKHVAKQIFLV